MQPNPKAGIPENMIRQKALRLPKPGAPRQVRLALTPIDAVAARDTGWSYFRKTKTPQIATETQATLGGP